MASIPSLNSIHHPSTATHNLITTLTSHTSYTSSLTLSGEFLFTGSSDREIKSWNRTPLGFSNYNMVVSAGKGAIKSLVLHSNKLFSAHQDQKIRVWKISDNQNHEQKYTLLATLPTFSDRISKGLIPKNHVKIRRHKKCTWVHHVDTVSALALSKDGTLLYSVSWDRTIKIWRTKDFKCLESLINAHDDAINAVAVSDDGHVYTGSADKRIKVWKRNQDEKTHTLLESLEKHNSGINALALTNSNGTNLLLYSGACDRSILVWEKGHDGKMVVVGALRGHTKSILCLAVVVDLICSGSEDKTIRIWRSIDHKEYYCLAVLEGHRGPIKSLTMVEYHCDPSEEASFIVYSGSLDCDIKVWQIFVPLI
ncbi:hypothetical protein TanjilG_31502 [Lupinus angustifolius]|uniref:Uncharacterized protein n=2 Tax=Lupinus angustifolius TaxID=3871 RepID=A0A4P1RTM0_LUPAN|nr:hypothetical protein TanjilG_31502 [Lupinus angustifolius]